MLFYWLKESVPGSKIFSYLPGETWSGSPDQAGDVVLAREAAEDALFALTDTPPGP